MDLVGVQINHGGSSTQVQWFPSKMVEQMFLTSQGSLMHKREGTIKKGSATELGEFSCCYYCHLRV